VGNSRTADCLLLVQVRGGYGGAVVACAAVSQGKCRWFGSLRGFRGAGAGLAGGAGGLRCVLRTLAGAGAPIGGRRARVPRPPGAPAAARTLPAGDRGPELCATGPLSWGCAARADDGQLTVFWLCGGNVSRA